MRKNRKIIFTVLALVLTICCFSSNFVVLAADYPLVIPEYFEQDCKVGSKVAIVYTYYPEFNNEILICNIYNSQGVKVATCQKQFDNRYSSYSVKYTINWDTQGLPVGKYKVVMTKRFYSFYEWHQAPSDTVCYVNLVKNVKIATPIVYATSNINYNEISWGKVNGAVKYVIYRRLGDSGSWVKIGTTTGTLFYDKTAYLNKYYTYSVRAYDSKNAYSDYKSSYCSTVYSKVRIPVVPKPSAISGNTGVEVSWNSVPNAYKYVVLRRKGTESTWTILTTLSNKTLVYTDTNVVNGVYYVYYIRAINANNEYSAYDKSKCYTCLFNSNTSIPQIPVVNAKLYEGGINLNWQPTANSSKYVVLKRLGTESSWTTVGTTMGTSIKDTDVKNGLYYVYYVRAINSSGQYASYDKSKCYTIKYNSDTDIPQIPQIRAKVTTGGISVTWNKTANAEEYVVLRRLGTASNWSIVGVTKNNCIVDYNVDKDIYYVYYIRALNANGEFAPYDKTRCYTIKY